MIAIWVIVPLVIGATAVWRPALAAAFLSFLWPAYLVRMEIFGIPTTLLEVALYAGVVGTMAAIPLRRINWPGYRIARQVRWWLVAWSIAWIIATLASPDQRAALGALKVWWFDPILYASWLWFVIRDQAERQLVIRLGVLSGVVVAVAGLFQLAFVRDSLQAGRLSSLYAPVANYAAMLLGPLLVVGTAWLTNRVLPKAWWFFLGLMALALLATVSYGGWLAVAAGAGVVWLFLPAGRIKWRFLWSAIITGAIFVSLLSLTPNFREHFNFDRSSSSVRKEIWVTSWALVQQHPILGIGPNAFEPAYRAELPKHYFPPLEWLVSQPHNLYLALWLELGLLGLLSFIAGAIGLIRALLRLTKNPDTRSLAIGSLAGLSAILVHGFVDTPILKNDLVMMTVWVIIISWIGQPTSRPPRFAEK